MKEGFFLRLPQSNQMSKPLVVMTGATGSIGSALADALSDDYEIVGLDLKCSGASFDCFEFDITEDDSVELALRKLRERSGDHLAAVVHLAAYFDFTGEEHPLYDAVNVEGTRRLLRALDGFHVERFVYTGTMLVHAPGVPGERIDESAPIEPKWAYPRSKAAAEEVIRQEAGDKPYALLHLAGLYDEKTAVPTLSHQIARIYERDIKSRVFAGDPRAGQSMVHKDDMIDALVRVIERRNDLSSDVAILIGEPEAVGYQRLQDRIGCLIHGNDEWATISVPRTVAKAGAWAEAKAEPVIPDAIDQGEKPFIRPFMIDMAEDHYALDISRARKLLGWAPRHKLYDELEHLIASLKDDPAGWYAANGITPPRWLATADEIETNGEAVRTGHETTYRDRHSRFLWGHFLNVGLGTWLTTAPFIMGYQSSALVLSDVISGLLLIALGLLSVSWRFGWARWAAAAVGTWLLFAPLVFWAPTAAAYNNDTIAGMLAIAFAVLTRPPPGVSSIANQAGPTIPPGWDFSPSSWFQRLPIIILAFVGLHISRYLAAYQLGHIDGVWEPFFAGSLAALNGTEEIITSRVSEAWPVSDAGVGAVTYALEILTGIIGSSRRWRTLPWLVLLFGFMIVPLGAVSITFIIIQPIVIGTWCTLCLVAAIAMLLQIPYSLDELVATCLFLWRRKKAGRSLLRVLFVGDTDDVNGKKADSAGEDDFAQSPSVVIREMLTGGVNLPWNLAACIVIGVWLMFTRLSLGSDGGMADAEHLIGALVITIAVTALAEIARPLRFLNILLGAALLVIPFIYGVSFLHLMATLICGLALMALSLRRGPVRNRYGAWSRLIV